MGLKIYQFKFVFCRIDFTIFSDGGKVDEWNYDVGYTEYLHQLPFIKNYAVANYNFKSLSEKEYAVKSSHKTCFFANITCGEYTYIHHELV